MSLRDRPPFGMRDAVVSVLRLLRAAGIWAAGTSVTTATVSAFARALCFPPYWPSGPLFRCRPDGTLPALLRASPDAAVTAVLLFVPALAVAAGVHVLVRGAQWLRFPPAARLLGVASGAGLWMLLVERLETSYLDFIVSSYAAGAGALVGALIGSRTMRRRSDA